jgi:hypothetical protein
MQKNKMTKEETDKAIDLFLEDTEKEIENWKNGVYKNSPDMQEWVKKKIITGLIQLPDSDLRRSILIAKLIENGIFTTRGEIDKALEIPIEKRIEFSFKDLLESAIPKEEMIIGNGIMPTKGYMVIASRE